MTQSIGMESGPGGKLKSEGICVYIWLIHLLYKRNPHSIVKQVYSNKKRRRKCSLFLMWRQKSKGNIVISIHWYSQDTKVGQATPGCLLVSASPTAFWRVEGKRNPRYPHPSILLSGFLTPRIFSYFYCMVLTY